LRLRGGSNIIGDDAYGSMVLQPGRQTADIFGEVKKIVTCTIFGGKNGRKLLSCLKTKYVFEHFLREISRLPSPFWLRGCIRLIARKLTARLEFLRVTNRNLSITSLFQCGMMNKSKSSLTAVWAQGVPISLASQKVGFVLSASFIC